MNKNDHNDIEEEVYINEIIRITYKCNWKCKFCNVLKTNNFWDTDVTDKEITYKILNLLKKYSKKQRDNLILSFSGWEPTLNKKLWYFIKLAKSIWVWTVQIQTNWTNLFLNKNLINELYEQWLDEIFLAQHSGDETSNKDMWIFYRLSDFEDWVSYVYDNNFHKKVQISFNIVINKINLFKIYDYINYLKKIGFIKLLPLDNNNWFENTKRISIWLVQPNWYANINKDEVLLKYDELEVDEIFKIIKLCKSENIYPDFHFTAPPLCIINIPDYNLEHHRMLKLNDDIKNNNINQWNLDSYKYLWKEKSKIDLCKKCKYNDSCLWFYNNWLGFVWEDYVFKKVNNFIDKYV